MCAFVVPTIYTAVDRMSASHAAITRSMVSMNAQIARADRLLNNLTPSFNTATKEMWDYAKGAAGVTAAIAGIAFSGKSLVDYEDAVASFRTIVSDLNNTQFEKFKDEITSVAQATRRSTVDVAQSFEKIAGLNEKFAQTSHGLGLVSEASITLAKASRMDLGPAAENLVNIMNQFSLGVEQADRTVNALAAGTAYGAASISQTAEAMTNFGSVAAGANIQIEKSVALIQLLAHYGVQGADAGDKLKSSISLLQKTGLGYASGQFEINDALDEMKKKYDALSTEMAQNAYIESVFGLNQIATGRILLTNIELLKEYTKAGTGTSEALKAAEINSNTLSNRLAELQARWVTLITTSDNVGAGFNAIKNTVVFITNNMEGLVAITATMVGVWGAAKVVIWAANAAFVAWNTNTLIGIFRTNIYTASLMKGRAAYYLLVSATYAQAAAVNFLNAGLATQIALSAGIIGAVGLITYGLLNGYDAAKDYNKELEQTKNGFVQLAAPISQAQVAMEKYNEAMRKYNNLQNFEAYLKYERNKGGVNALASHAYNSVFNSDKYAKAKLEEMYPGSEAPKFSDFPGIDSAKATPVYLNVVNNVDKAGNVTTTVSGGANANILPKTTSTSY